MCLWVFGKEKDTEVFLRLFPPNVNGYQISLHTWGELGRTEGSQPSGVGFGVTLMVPLAESSCWSMSLWGEIPENTEIESGHPASLLFSFLSVWPQDSTEFCLFCSGFITSTPHCLSFNKWGSEGEVAHMGTPEDCPGPSSLLPLVSILASQFLLREACLISTKFSSCKPLLHCVPVSGDFYTSFIWNDAHALVSEANFRDLRWKTSFSPVWFAKHNSWGGWRSHEETLEPITQLSPHNLSYLFHTYNLHRAHVKCGMLPQASCSVNVTTKKK